jgi:hypothetical protein
MLANAKGATARLPAPKAKAKAAAAAAKAAGGRKRGRPRKHPLPAQEATQPVIMEQHESSDSAGSEEEVLPARKQCGRVPAGGRVPAAAVEPAPRGCVTRAATRQAT